MIIEILASDGSLFTKISGVDDPEKEFENATKMYGEQSADSWREVEPEQISPEAQQAAAQKALTDAVQAYMDAAAKAKGYDNLLSAVTYAEEPAVPKFEAEGIAFRAWRSAVWAYCYDQMAAVLTGQREIPTPEQLVIELPYLILPD